MSVSPTATANFVYDGDGIRLLKVEGGAALEITTYYAGQMFEKQFNTTANQLGEGQSTNANCSGGANGMTDYGFTGQRNETAFGLMDFNARYYSSRLGAFIQPDTIVADASETSAYNRYAYVTNNPLRYTDPSGHCKSSSHLGDEPQPVADIEGCWDYADHILRLWDNDQSGYWQNRWGSKEVFRNYIAATANNDADFMLNEINMYWTSDTYRDWETQHPPAMFRPPPPVDVGDYWAMTFGAGIVEASLIRDDYGNWYIRGGAGINTGGLSISRGDILVNTNPEASPFQNLADIDTLNLSPEEKKVVARQVLTGWSASASGTYYLGAGGSSGLRPPYHASIEATLGAPGVSLTVWSYTFNVVWTR